LNHEEHEEREEESGETTDKRGWTRIENSSWGREDCRFEISEFTPGKPVC
jgi:hypothetical protein